MLPQAVKLVLWSYDTDKIDLNSQRQLIVSQVLNFGSKEATDWLFDYYGKAEVARVARGIPRGRWDKKSLALWSLVLGLAPDQIKGRFE
jgi:hypothetical protein